MAFNEDLMKLRQKLNDFVRLEVIDHKNFRELYQATLIEIMAEIERKRRDILKAQETLHRQIAVEDGRLLALDQMNTLIFAVVDGYVRAQEKALEEEKARQVEQKEKEELAKKVEPPPPVEEKPKKKK